MTGIVEKWTEGKGLFESEIEFMGKHAIYVRYLKDELKVFPTYREVYILGAIVGFLEKKKGSYDNSYKEKPASIFADQLGGKYRSQLKFIYRTIMLLDDDDKLSLEERKNRAFRDDPQTNKDLIRENMNIFNDYACGGVEYLYTQLQLKNSDDVDAKVKKIKEFLTWVSIENNLIVDKELSSFNFEE